MGYDVSGSYQSQIDENRRKMKEIQEKKPKDYFMDKEWKSLNEDNRQLNAGIESYKRAVRFGIQHIHRI